MNLTSDPKLHQGHILGGKKYKEKDSLVNEQFRNSKAAKVPIAGWESVMRAKRAGKGGVLGPRVLGGKTTGLSRTLFTWWYIPHVESVRGY